MIAGMILFDKPPGWTSHDAVEAFRRMLPKGAKVGHCGTLDPLATGLLILLVGPCTRLQARLQGWDKAYSGKIRLGLETDTGDIEGRILKSRPVPPLGLEDLQRALDSHRGAFERPAPAFSAVKHRGRPLYQYARRGISVPPKLRRSTVYAWKALAYAEPDLEHALECSSGTYVRSLAQSVGEALGCGASVSSLRRDRIAVFSAEEALSLEQAKCLSLSVLKTLLQESLPRLDAALLPRSPRA